MPTVFVNNVKTQLSEIGNCPECGASWDAGAVYDGLRAHAAYADKTDDEVREIAAQYGDSDAHFSRLIGVEIRGAYDGVLLWQCPDCQTQWRRADINV
jgi:ribosomal protein L37AE/L43A